MYSISATVEPIQPNIMTTYEPTYLPTVEPTHEPTYLPTLEPTFEPTYLPTVEPTYEPTYLPTVEPTYEPTHLPTLEPTSEPSTVIVGYDAISREIADTGTGMQFVSEYAFSDDGILLGWDVYVNRQCSITLQVFRPSGTDYRYDLVASTVANVNVGANSIPALIQVEAGDVLGWYQSGVQPFVFDNGGLIVRRAYGYTGSDSTVSMSGHAGGWNRMYSISATVGPTSGRRQMRLMQMSEGEKNVKNARLYDDRQMKQAQKL